jgi:hypothetical protein
VEVAAAMSGASTFTFTLNLDAEGAEGMEMECAAAQPAGRQGMAPPRSA